jgi:hypothetical protein
MKKKDPLRGRHRTDSLTKTLLGFLMEVALVGDLIDKHEMAPRRDRLRNEIKNLLIYFIF